MIGQLACSRQIERVVNQLSPVEHVDRIRIRHHLVDQQFPVSLVVINSVEAFKRAQCVVVILKRMNQIYIYIDGQRV